MAIRQKGNQMNSYIGAPALKHPELKSLSEVQSERDNEAPRCSLCNDFIDADDDPYMKCKDCRAEEKREERRAYEREHGYVDADDYYGRGRGLPK
jgi:tRNA(Ile2) C34 agmatinyltransferase TiaS